MPISILNTNPAGSQMTGNTLLFINGTGFNSPTITIAGEDCTNVTVQSTTTIACTTPAITLQGVYPLTVTDGGNSASINYAAYPFSDAIAEKMWEIWGLPQHGFTVNTITLVLYPYSNVDTWAGGFNSKGDLTQIIRDISKIMSMLSVSQIATATEILETWAEIQDSEMVINEASNGSKGTIVNDYERRVQLRLRLANICGISVPRDGYLHEIESVYGKSLAQFRRGQDSGSSGDR